MDRVFYISTILFITSMFYIRPALCQTIDGTAYIYINNNKGNSLLEKKSCTDSHLYFPGGLKNNVDVCSLKQNADSNYVLPINKTIKLSDKQNLLSLPIFFSQNVSSFVIYFPAFGKNKMGYFSSNQINGDGYQASIKSSIQTLNQIDAKKIFGENNIDVNYVYIKIIPNKNSIPSKLIINGLYVYDSSSIKMLLSPLPFFKYLVTANKNYYSKNDLKVFTPFWENGRAKYNWFSQEFSKSPIILNGDTSEIAVKHALLEILSKSILDYPFYVEKRINKDSTYDSFLNIWNTNYNRPLCSLDEQIDIFLRRTFSDGHFKLNYPICPQNSNRSSIQFFPIHNMFKVAAVFDTTLIKTIPLGSTITQINNRPIEDIVDSLENNYYNPQYTNLRREASLTGISSQLSSFIKGKSIKYNYVTPTGNVDSILAQNSTSTFKIPSNFLNKSYECKTLNAHTVYIKFNTFDEQILTNLFSSTYDKSIQDKDVVLDLRGNFGGDIIYIPDILSFFVQNKQVTILKAQDRVTNKQDSIILSLDNPYKFSNQSNVTVLIDSKTACAAEIFLYDLKRYNKNVIVFGTDNTSGTIANAMTISYNNNFSITINAPDSYKYLVNGSFIEWKGLSPDIKINIDSVNQLKPYNDFILQTALNYLQEKHHESKESNVATTLQEPLNINNFKN